MAQTTPNILVVEDDRETRTLIAKYLRTNACNVATAAATSGNRTASRTAGVDRSGQSAGLGFPVTGVPGISDDGGTGTVAADIRLDEMVPGSTGGGVGGCGDRFGTTGEVIPHLVRGEDLSDALGVQDDASEGHVASRAS